MQYQEALSWIHSIRRFGMNQGLQRIETLLGYLGDPHKKLQYLHIGGSNGKGSIAAFTASVLESAGYRAGLYTSPYLEQFTDRMSVNGEEISKEHLAELAAFIKPLTEKLAADPALGQPTEFEVVTALSLKYFAEVKPDIVVLEVGLGGRLDATNVVSPLVSVINTVSLEHTQVLGNTLASIAREKGGIIKRNTDLATQAAGEALPILEEICREKEAPLYRLGREFRIEIVSSDLEAQAFHYYGLRRNFSALRIPLLGEYQINNAAVALASLELLERKGFPWDEESMRRGLRATRWPGRLEILGRDPLVVIDGAHNSEAFRELRRAIQQLFPSRKLILILGVLADKAINDLLSEIIPAAETVILTKPVNPRAAHPLELEKIAREICRQPVFVEEEIAAAIEKAYSLAATEDVILISGSLYLISEARRILKSN